jgi:hypothetical protein
MRNSASGKMRCSGYFLRSAASFMLTSAILGLRRSAGLTWRASASLEIVSNLGLYIPRSISEMREVSPPAIAASCCCVRFLSRRKRLTLAPKVRRSLTSGGAEFRRGMLPAIVTKLGAAPLLIIDHTFPSAAPICSFWSLGTSGR